MKSSTSKTCLEDQELLSPNPVVSPLQRTASHDFEPASRGLDQTTDFSNPSGGGGGAGGGGGSSSTNTPDTSGIPGTPSSPGIELGTATDSAEVNAINRMLNSLHRERRSRTIAQSGEPGFENFTTSAEVFTNPSLPQTQAFQQLITDYSDTSLEEAKAHFNEMAEELGISEADRDSILVPILGLNDIFRTVGINIQTDNRSPASFGFLPRFGNDRLPTLSSALSIFGSSLSEPQMIVVRDSIEAEGLGFMGSGLGSSSRIYRLLATLLHYILRSGLAQNFREFFTNIRDASHNLQNRFGDTGFVTELWAFLGMNNLTLFAGLSGAIEPWMTETGMLFVATLRIAQFLSTIIQKLDDMNRNSNFIRAGQLARSAANQHQEYPNIRGSDYIVNSRFSNFISYPVNFARGLLMRSQFGRYILQNYPGFTNFFLWAGYAVSVGSLVVYGPRIVRSLGSRRLIGPNGGVPTVSVPIVGSGELPNSIARMFDSHVLNHIGDLRNLFLDWENLDEVGPMFQRIFRDLISFLPRLTLDNSK